MKERRPGGYKFVRSEPIPGLEGAGWRVIMEFDSNYTSPVQEKIDKMIANSMRPKLLVKLLELLKIGDNSI